MRPPKTVPIPTPAPARPMVARPAPWILAAATMAAAVDSATMPRFWMTLRAALLRKALRAATRVLCWGWRAALEKPRAATRAAPKERAMATMVMVLTVGVEMSWR
eukprot:Amastigsp_a6644_4.p4 type:complete len:105 gc:universal Amastigsp_a6644_4:61-375(+)